MPRRPADPDRPARVPFKLDREVATRLRAEALRRVLGPELLAETILARALDVLEQSADPLGQLFAPPAPQVAAITITGPTDPEQIGPITRALRVAVGRHFSHDGVHTLCGLRVAELPAGWGAMTSQLAWEHAERSEVACATCAVRARMASAVHLPGPDRTMCGLALDDRVKLSRWADWHTVPETDRCGACAAHTEGDPT